MKYSIRTCCVLSVMILGACSETPTAGTPTSQTGDAQLAVLNALAGNSSVNLTLDGGAYPLPQVGHSAAIAISGGLHHLTASLTTGQLLASADFAVAAGGRRTAVLSGSPAASISLLVASDTASLPPANKAKVRLVQSDPSLPLVDAFLTWSERGTDSTAHFSNLIFVTGATYGTGSDAQFPGFIVIDPNVYTIGVTAHGSTVPLVQTQFTAQAGETWSVILSAAVDGTLLFTPIREGN